jgi:hypothetical protein
VASIYRRLGYAEVPALTRWVVPLSPEYLGLLPDAEHSPERDRGAKDWLAGRSESEPAGEEPVSPAALAAAWARQATGNGLWRSASFYAWRYQASPGFQYRQLRVGAGFALARVEQPLRDGAAPVLRILELLPATPGAWTGPAADHELIPGVLAWGRRQGCCAADFQVAGRWLAPSLAAAGMRERSTTAPETRLAEVLRPYRPTAAPINVFHRTAEPVRGDWLFLKTDGDMDRPNDPCLEHVDP